ncbi:Uncharacterised protein [Achromobacter xylosoxidans]|uniref:hypothetical protein n=1 Tax=Alcaligenes xylosoxydans xylosoxydans TaxID=85698 RepID=UPI0006C1897F|nr:hypothetical protein [Achromobacter xylosoxidans]CUJ53187.1 Uncharacterised protein [Achromobacter xylosoxidans]
MNDQLQAALAEIIGKTGNALSDGVGFLKAELPSVIQQLLYWKMISSFMGMVITLVFSYAAFVFIRRGFRAATDFPPKQGSYGDDPKFWMRFWLTVVSAVIGLISFVSVLNSFTWLKIWIAPKVYLIEYAASLAK